MPLQLPPLSSAINHDWTEHIGETERLRGLWAIAKSAGWIVPHEHVCWIAERPETLCTDTHGRLHCADGPALRYRDGWSVYSWKGVRTPAWIIAHPERITRARISKTFEFGRSQGDDRHHTFSAVPQREADLGALSSETKSELVETK